MNSVNEVSKNEQITLKLCYATNYICQLILSKCQLQSPLSLPPPLLHLPPALRLLRVFSLHTHARTKQAETNGQH